MRLYTITTEKAFSALNERGWLTGNARYAWRGFLPAYRWMSTQMNRRVGPSRGRSSYPIWAWVAKPDLRARGHLPGGTNGYRLEITVPDEDVLLSDFSLWHIVLNESYLSRDEDDEARFETRERSNIPNSVLRLEIQKSWERIFDVRGDRDSDWWGKEPDLQATFWRLDKAQVKEATPFLAR